MDKCFICGKEEDGLWGKFGEENGMCSECAVKESLGTINNELVTERDKQVIDKLLDITSQL